MRKFTILFAILIFAMTGFAQTKYKTYANARFGYSIEYPADLLTPSRIEDATNSGKTFLSKDKSAEMRVWGEYDALERTLEGEFREDLKEYGAGVTYRVLLKNSFVISGIKGDKIFYQKTLRRKLKEIDVFYTFTIEYKKSDREKFNAIVQQIAKSFKFDPNADV